MLGTGGIDLPVVEDLQALLVSGVALMDTRAPVEFGDGAFPSAQNLPLMSDEERDAIGKCYKALGQDKAIELGVKLVSGAIKDERIKGWETFFQQNPDAALYCFRGGLRSRITQQWLYEKTGVAYPRVEGGYKALRRYLLDKLEVMPAQYKALLVSGRTGSGKTRFLMNYQQQVDLEGLANHRGSAFGPQVTPQPTQVSFENALAIRFLQQLAQGHQHILLEDESRNIGSVHLPAALLAQMAQAEMIMLDVPNDEREAISYQEYVVDMVVAFTEHMGSEAAGFQAFSDYILGSLAKIRRRLGGVRYEQVKGLMQQALAQQQKTGDTQAHLEWVRFILFEYYDPMYDYQISKKQGRIIFQGNSAEVAEYLAELGVG